MGAVGGDLDDGGPLGPARGHCDDGAAIADRQAPEVGEPAVDLSQRAAADNAQVTNAARHPGAPQGPVARPSICRLSEHPRRNAELAPDAVVVGQITQDWFGRSRPRVDVVDCPPPAGVGDDVELAVGSPARLLQRGAIHQHTVGAGYRCAVIQLDEVQPGVVPRHVRVVPAQVGEHRAVGAGPWRCVEVGAPCHDRDCSVQPDRNDLIAWLALGPVVGLTHPHGDRIERRAIARHRLCRGYERRVGVAVCPRGRGLGGDRNRFGAALRVEESEPLVPHACTQHEMAAIGRHQRQPGTAAVLMDRGANVCVGCPRHICGLRFGIVGRHPNHGAAAALEGAFFNPVRPAIGDSRFRATDCSGGNIRCSQR